MSRRCINPASLTGERGDPPEYESDNPATCSDCGEEIDLDDDEYERNDDGDYLCENCLDDPIEEDEEEDDECV